jgi:hypothetical protein
VAEDSGFDQFSNKGWQNRFPEGARLATLQDYWKRAGCAEDLYEEPGTGKHFTLVHMPLKWQDGTETIKASFMRPPEALITLLKAELAREIRETFFEPIIMVFGPDHRLQWDGVVLPTFSLLDLSTQALIQDSRLPISVLANGAAFCGYTNFAGAAFLGHTSFVDAAFSGAADFWGTTFLGEANFEGAVFSSYVSFWGVTFSNIANFSSATFLDYNNFSGVTFSANANFDRVICSGNANFSSAAFSSRADFRSSAFFKIANFDRAAFSDLVSFENAVFLLGAVFSGKGNSVKSDGVKAEIKVRASEKTIQDYEQPEALMWTAHRSFPSSDFSECIFMGAASFDNRDFHDAASFDGAKFYREAEFHGSQLHRAILFTQTDFELALKPEKRQWQGVPREALERLHGAAMLNASEEEQRSLEDWAEARFAEIREQDDALTPKEDDPDRSRYFERVEEGFRTLKHAMEERRNRGQEARFFKLELRARRMRRDRFVPWWERWISDGYRLTSDFGTSIRRPLGWFVGAIFVFALLYWCMILLPYGFFFGEGEWPSWATWGEALSFSLGRVFPFGPWGDPELCSAIGQMLSPLSEGETCAQPRAFGPGTPIGLRVLASVQSLIALVLVFLSGLAIRRRFQIN